MSSVPTTRPAGPRRASLGLTSRQVNLALEILIVSAVVTGLASWSVGDRWNGALTFAHGVCGIALALLLPTKMRGSVRTVAAGHPGRARPPGVRLRPGRRCRRSLRS